MGYSRFLVHNPGFWLVLALVSAVDHMGNRASPCGHTKHNTTHVIRADLTILSFACCERDNELNLPTHIDLWYTSFLSDYRQMEREAERKDFHYL